MRKIFVFFTIVLSFLFLPILKVDGMTVGINQTSEIPSNLFEGIYYINGSNVYVWVVKNEIPDNTRFAATYLDQDGTFHEYSSFYFGDMVYATGDIIQLNPLSSYFATLWQGVEHINRLVEAGYLFYSIGFGISKPSVDIFYRMSYYGTDIIISVYPKRRIDDIFNYIDDIIELTEEELLAEYNRGYNDGYQEGFDDGYNNALENISTNDYTLGYRDGFKAGEKSKIAQNNEAFYNNIEKWLVPAIITVL